jgi:hypothetical protein
METTKNVDVMGKSHEHKIDHGPWTTPQPAERNCDTTKLRKYATTALTAMTRVVEDETGREKDGIIAGVALELGIIGESLCHAQGVSKLNVSRHFHLFHVHISLHVSVT